jgi:hypothetical protein
MVCDYHMRSKNIQGNSWRTRTSCSMSLSYKATI